MEPFKILIDHFHAQDYGYFFPHVVYSCNWRFARHWGKWLSVDHLLYYRRTLLVFPYHKWLSFNPSFQFGYRAESTYICCFTRVILFLYQFRYLYVKRNISENPPLRGSMIKQKGITKNIMYLFCLLKFLFRFFYILGFFFCLEKRPAFLLFDDMDASDWLVTLVGVRNDSGRAQEIKGGKTKSATCHEFWREESQIWLGFRVNATAVYQESK